MSRLKPETMEKVGVLGRILHDLERSAPMAVDTTIIPGYLRTEACMALIPVIERALAKMGIEVVR